MIFYNFSTQSLLLYILITFYVLYIFYTHVLRVEVLYTFEFTIYNYIFKVTILNFWWLRLSINCSWTLQFNSITLIIEIMRKFMHYHLWSFIFTFRGIKVHIYIEDAAPTLCDGHDPILPISHNFLADNLCRLTLSACVCVFMQLQLRNFHMRLFTSFIPYRFRSHIT